MWYNFVVKRHHKDVKYERNFKFDAEAIKYAKDNNIDFVLVFEDSGWTEIYSKEKEEAKMTKPKYGTMPLLPRGAILHITCGSDTEWHPTDAELSAVEKLFVTALDDPSGAIVVTRSGIKTSFILPNGEITRPMTNEELKKELADEEQKYIPRTDEELAAVAAHWDAQKSNKHPDMKGFVDYKGLRQEKPEVKGLYNKDIDKLVRMCVMNHGGDMTQSVTVCREIILDMLHQRGVPVIDEPKTTSLKEASPSRYNPVYDVRKPEKVKKELLEDLSPAVPADDWGSFHPLYDIRETLPTKKKSPKKKVSKKVSVAQETKLVKALKTKIKFHDVLGSNAAKVMRNAVKKSVVAK